MKYTDCDMYYGILNVLCCDECIGMCEEQNTECGKWLDPAFECPHLKELEAELEERQMEDRIMKGE